MIVVVLLCRIGVNSKVNKGEAQHHFGPESLDAAKLYVKAKIKMFLRPSPPPTFMAPVRKRLKTDHVSTDKQSQAVSQSTRPIDTRPAASHEPERSLEFDSLDYNDEVENEDVLSAVESIQESQLSDESEGPQSVPIPAVRNGNIVAFQTAKGEQNGKRTHQKRGTVAQAPGLAAGGVDPMLQQTHSKHVECETEAEEALHRLRETIEAMPALGQFNIRDARRALKEQKVGIPFPDPQPADDSNLKFAYARPASVNVVGSYPVKTSNRLTKFLHIDMVVQMPDDLFQEKDYINYRYFHKRAFYLACLTSAIKAAHGKTLELRYQYHHDEPLQPVLTVRAMNKTTAVEQSEGCRTWQINVLPAVSSTVFPAAKLMPDKLSIRQAEQSWSKLQLAARNASYNASLRSDMLITPYLKLLHGASTSCQEYRDACSLGSTWLRQRGFRATSRKGGFASFEWAALIALLLQPGETQKSLLAPHMSSVQIFKTTLHLLASRDLQKQPLELGRGTPLGTSIDKTAPVVWDAGRAHNILYKMSVWSYRRLQREAKLTLAMLGDADFDGFHASFAQSKEIFTLNYDFIYEIELSALQQNTSKAGTTENARELYQVLKRGLGNRVSQIDITIDRTKAWSIADSRRRGALDSTVRVGLIVEPKNVDRLVDHGPPAEDKVAAAAFRQFWGDKAELRRFKDGSILEAIVWDGNSKEAPVLDQVLRWLLLNKYGSEIIQHTRLQGASHMLKSGKLEMDAMSSEAFRKLEMDIRGLQELLLPIRQIMLATSAGLTNDHTLTRADVVLQFETSARWPDDLAAIQRTKIAFLLNISKHLQQSVNDIHTAVGLENEGRDIFNQGLLDITYPSGSAFRLRILHDREQTLLDRILKNKGSDQRNVEVAAQALATYRREYISKPAHTQAMLKLCSRHLVLRQTIAVVKRWIASHLLQNHISTELIELIVAQTFTRPWPWQTPSSGQVAFLRTIVWLAKWDWRTQPLIVELGTDSKMTVEDKKAIRTRFAAWRKLDPAMNKVAMFVASSVDHDGTTYTAERPSKVVAGRLTALARAASSQITAQDLELQPSSLFTSALSDYDFVIHLNPHFDGASSKRGAARYKNLEPDLNVTDKGANPLHDFLTEIEDICGAAVLFFSGLPYKPIISGLWTPQTAERPWKMNLAFSSAPIDTDGGVNARLNKTAMLAEISRLGGELLERIEVIKHD